MDLRKFICAVPALLLASAMFLAGCETTAGVGRDIEAAGEGIEGSAERHQPYGSPSQN